MQRMFAPFRPSVPGPDGRLADDPEFPPRIGRIERFFYDPVDPITLSDRKSTSSGSIVWWLSAFELGADAGDKPAIGILLFYGTSMLKRTKVYSPSPVKQSDFVSTQKARAVALEKAESERAQKRLDNDALLDVNASKWRYDSHQ